MAAVCLKCQALLSPGLQPDDPSAFEIEFARALLGAPGRGSHEVRTALGELVKRFDVVATRLLNARATNAELETSLKIARSNLVLAEANTEALEETLRRRAPALQPAAFPGAALSTGLLGRVTTPDTNLWGDPLIASPMETDEHPKNAISAFFRRKRAVTPLIVSPAPDSAVSTDFPALPPSPNEIEPPADYATNGLLPAQAASLVEERTMLARRLDQLTALLQNERVATKELRNSHADLVAERDKLNDAHNEMQGELETLSAALFEEANTMVATERRKVAQYEQEIYDLRSELELVRRGSEMGLGGIVPSTARPWLPDSSPSVATDLSPAISQRTGDSYSQQESSSQFGSRDSPALPKSSTSSPVLQLSATSSPSFAASPAFATSPVLSASKLGTPEEAPGRQWLKSFNSRKPGTSRKGGTIEDALASIEADPSIVPKPPTPHSGDSVRRSLTLEDNDLLPTSVTPSPGVSPNPGEARLPPVGEPVPLRESTIKAVPFAEDADRRSRTTSYESWNKRSTSSSFASPNIETAFLNSPPVPALPKYKANGRSEKAHQTVSPKRSSSLSRRVRPSSPPAMPALSPNALEQRSPDPAYSEPILQSASFSRSDGSLPRRESSAKSAHLSQSSMPVRDKRNRPPPLHFTTPPTVSSEQMPSIERAPTPRSARRAGLVLGLDAAQLFPHRGPEADGLSAKLRNEGDVRTYAGASKGFAQALSYAAPNGRGVGLMRQIPQPDTPLSPMARDLDKLLDELSQINDELAIK